jgi:integrase/recombinase XerC
MHLNGFFSYLQFEKRYSKHTVDAYRNDIKQFVAYTYQSEIPAADTDLTKITYRQVRSWVVHLMANKITAKSVNRKISSLKTYYKYLLKQGVIKKSPMQKIVSPKIPKYLPLFIEEKAMDGIFNYMDEHYPNSSPEEQYILLRDKLIIEMLYGTGMRRSELLSVRDQDFDRNKKTVKILGKGNKERILPVSNKILSLLAAYVNQRNNVFGKTQTLLLSNTGGKPYPRMVHNVVHRVLSKNTSLTRNSPHVLRHTFATHLSNNGAELTAVKELLGHATLASTQVYTHNTIDKLKEIHRLAHPKA